MIRSLCSSVQTHADHHAHTITRSTSMTASESLSPVAFSRRKPIKVITRNDVLLGRGPALSKLEGNLRFRKLVDDRKELSM